MKQHLKLLNDNVFTLVHKCEQPFSNGPEPTVIYLDHTGFSVSGEIKKKVTVYPGMLLATHPSQHTGNLFSPVHGTVSDVTQTTIILSVTPPQENVPSVSPIDLLSLQAENLASALKNLGVTTYPLCSDCDRIIINGLNPEPGISWAEPMLTAHSSTLQTGLTLYKKLNPNKHIILALPKGSSTEQSYHEIPITYVPATYPNNLDPLLIKAITGKEFSENIAVVGLQSIWNMGLAVETGLPLTETVITLNANGTSTNYLVKEGTTVTELLSFAHINLENGDTVVCGGPFQGESISTTDYGIKKDTQGIFVIKAHTTPSMEDNLPCINCSACVQVCPSRLNPDLLSRYTEFQLYDRCTKEYIDQCIECGLCGYVCISRRPVLQHIRLAKYYLATKNEETSSHKEDVEGTHNA